MKNLILVTLFLLSSLNFNTDWFEIFQADVFVDYTNGSDSNSGSWFAPVKTISHANAIASSGDRIGLKSGETWNETITVPANNITYKKVGNDANPKITGFTTISGWSDEGGGIYSKALTVESNPEIVTINGVQYAMGRTPNANRYEYKPSDYYHIDSFSGDTQITDSECNSATTDWDGAEIVVRTAENTDWKRKTISSHSGTTLTFAALGENPAAGYGYFIQKDIRTLDQFGEWFYGSGKIYVYFGSEVPTDYIVKVSSKDKLIDVNTRDSITVKNIDLEGANSTAITTNASSSNAYNLTISHCNFDFNYTAIYGHQAPNMKVVYCNILRSSDRGIYNHWNSDGYYIAHNVLDSTGLIIGAANGAIDSKTMSGIYCGYARQLLSSNKGIIEYNTVKNTGFYGITFGGDSAIARYNLVDKFCTRLADGGGIHKTGSSSGADTLKWRNMQIVNNIVLNGLNQTDSLGFPAGTTNTQINGIYVDVYSFDINVNNNTMAHIPNGAYMLGVQDFEFKNNTIYDCDYGVKFHKRANSSDLTLPIRNLTADGNIVVNDESGTLPLVSFKDLTSGDLLSFGTINDNYYSHIISNTTPFEQSIVYTKTNLNFAAWQSATGEDADSYLTLNKGDSTLFEYNASTSPKIITFDGSYITADSIQFEANEKDTLLAYESGVYFKDTVTTIIIDSIYAAYPLNANAQDSVASQDGTVTGATLITAGKFKGAYDFATNTDNIYFPINTSDLTAADSSYSVSFWVKLDQTASTLGYATYLFSDIKTGTSYKMALQINTSNTLVFQTRNTALSVYTVNSATGIMNTTGVWYHIVINIPSAGEIGQIYVNGSRTTGGSQNTFTGASRASDYRFYASKYTGTSGFDGKMDDIVIRKCWTTAEEAADIYNNSKYYPFTGQ